MFFDIGETTVSLHPVPFMYDKVQAMVKTFSTHVIIWGSITSKLEARPGTVGRMGVGLASDRIAKELVRLGLFQSPDVITGEGFVVYMDALVKYKTPAFYQLHNCHQTGTISSKELERIRTVAPTIYQRIQFARQAAQRVMDRLDDLIDTPTARLDKRIIQDNNGDESRLRGSPATAWYCPSRTWYIPPLESWGSCRLSPRRRWAWNAWPSTW